MATNNPASLAPTMAQAIGFHDRRVDVGYDRDTVGTPVQKGHGKVAIDPSEGSANARAQTMERGGARYRVHPLMTQPNHEASAATQANGRVVGTAIATDYSGTGDYSGGEVAEFEDAPVIAGYAPGHHRVRGYTQNG